MFIGCSIYMHFSNVVMHFNYCYLLLLRSEVNHNFVGIKIAPLTKLALKCLITTIQRLRKLMVFTLEVNNALAKLRSLVCSLLYVHLLSVSISIYGCKGMFCYSQRKLLNLSQKKLLKWRNFLKI